MQTIYIWELFSIGLLAAVVAMFSGPREALTNFMRNCSFEVFVEIVDRTSSNLYPELVVVLPTAFLCLVLTVLTSHREASKLFALNVNALVLFTAALLVAIVFEVPLAEEIVTWAALASPGDWLRVRNRWLRFHIARVVLTSASLILLALGGGIQALHVLLH